VNKRLVYSGASQAQQLQQFIEANIYHRQGFVFGAKENKQLQIFIDDLNLPLPDEFSVQKSNEVKKEKSGVFTLFPLTIFIYSFVLIHYCFMITTKITCFIITQPDNIWW
jgi:hypothetical protein